jgi:hypothetical protein
MPLHRSLLAVAVSLALHAALVALVLGNAVWKGWRMSRNVDIELVSTKVDEVKQLPFGPPPPPPGERARPARRPRPPRAAIDDGVKVAAADAGADGGDAAAPDAGSDRPDAGADTREAGSGEAGSDARPVRPRDLRAYGPEGSRLTVILRLDRLRDSPEAPATIAAVDALLRHLPDRRRLLDGTDLDLYRDFDALLVATPNPLDDAVTFLAARHKLTDEVLKAALARGAAAGGRTLVWRQEDDRPVGVRRRLPAAPDAGEIPADRDDRIMVLPRPGLAVMAPPAYAALLLKNRPAVDAGADGAPGPAPPRWQQLLERIDAEDGAMPEGAVLMMTAANLLSSRRGRSADGQPVTGPAGLALPAFATALVGTTPAPTLEVAAEFDRLADARAWEEKWPGLKRELLQSPLLLLSGFTSIVARAELARDGSTVVVRTGATTRELQRMLLVIGNMLPAAQRARP